MFCYYQEIGYTVYMSTSIYRAYDVRGIYPTQINEKIADKVGRAVVLYLQQNNLLHAGGRILVARDVRLSAPSMAVALINVITNLGIGVDDAGIMTTDGFYFGVGSNNYMAGVMVTASHNPSEYIGFKFVTENVKLHPHHGCLIKIGFPGLRPYARPLQVPRYRQILLLQELFFRIFLIPQV